MDNKIKCKLRQVGGLLLIVIIVTCLGRMINEDVFSPANKGLPIYSVDTKDKKMCITFDVNWGDDKTEEILNILDEFDIKATFYIMGLWCDDFPERVVEIANRGHEIGNHSNKHSDYTTLSKDNIVNDIEITNAKILNLTGKTPKTFRFPSGAYNDMSVKVVEETGLKPIQWDVDSVDWKAKGAEVEYNRVVSKAKEGSIMLFHNDGKYTPENLKKIIKKYQDEGYEFVTVSELIYEDNYYLDHAGKQILIKN